MDRIAPALAILVAVEHVYILVLEMFLWTTPKGMKTFGISRDFAQQSRGLAANQGLYNGFLAAGLAFGLQYPDAVAGRHIQLFFLACIVVAGVFGGLTAKRSILWIQGFPALLALIAVALAKA